MKETPTSFHADRPLRTRKQLAVGAMLLLLAALFYWKADQNFRTHDYVNSNFFSFWVSGHMVWTGESPYDAAQWRAAFDAYHATYFPSKILQYPLPLMYFMAPIGALPVGTAYFAWQLICEVILAVAIAMLLRRQPHALGLVLLLTPFLLFFGPEYLSLQVGSVGAIALLAVALALLLLKEQHPFAAGVALSMTLLKPPQALTLLALVGIWFLARRQWKAIAGLAAGSILLLAAWLARDPAGIAKFRGSSDFLLGHTLGVQSNIFSYSYLACGGVSCMWILGSIGSLLILATGAYILWRNRARWSDWEAFSLIIPLGFVTALYLWSYDQLLYVIPIVWIACRLLERWHSYVPVIIFLIVLDVVAFAALAFHAYTQRDLLNILTSLVVLGLFGWLTGRPAAPPPQTLS
ncbi:MAG: glycosyltransferase family 87 protein [Anaerolineae bacterium]